MQVEESTHSFGEGREMCFMQKSSKTQKKYRFPKTGAAYRVNLCYLGS